MRTVEVWDPQPLFRLVDVLGVVGNGLLGGVIARQKEFDLVGFVFLAIFSGLGGGMIRDVLLNSGWPVALTDPAYLTGALAAALVAYAVNLESTVPRRALVVIDMLALGSWSATGTLKALGMGLTPIPAILLGVITAVGGGMIRDVLAGRVPAVLGGNTLYATLGIIGSIEALVAFQLGAQNVGMALSIVTCTVLGLLARRRHWVLPKPVTLDLRAPLANREQRRRERTQAETD